MRLMAQSSSSLSDLMRELDLDSRPGRYLIILPRASYVAIPKSGSMGFHGSFTLAVFKGSKYASRKGA